MDWITYRVNIPVVAQHPTVLSSRIDCPPAMFHTIVLRKLLVHPSIRKTKRRWQLCCLHGTNQQTIEKSDSHNICHSTCLEQVCPGVALCWYRYPHYPWHLCFIKFTLFLWGSSLVVKLEMKMYCGLYPNCFGYQQ